MKIQYAFLLLLLPFYAFSEEYRFVLNSGHNGSSRYLQYDNSTQYAVSISDEGELLLIAADTQRVIKKYILSHNTLVDLKFNPEFSELAFVTYSNLQFTLEVWDWHRGVRLYTRDLEDKPLFLEYTMAGNHLVFGQSNIPSIVFLDHQTGKERTWLKNHSSLYQDVYIGGSESNIMTYNLSGQIKYIRLDNGESLGTVTTQSGLEWLEVLQTGRKNLVIGKKGNTFYILDRQTGEVQDTYAQDRILAVDLDTETSLLSLAVDIRGNTFLKQYNLAEGVFYPVNDPLLLTRDKEITSITALGELTLVGTVNGDFYNFFNETEELIPFFEEKQLTFLDLQFFDNALYISSPERMIRLDSPYFQADSSMEDIQKVKQTNQMYPNRGEFHFYKQEDELFAFSSNADQPAPLMYSNQDGLLERVAIMGDNLLSGDTYSLLNRLFLFKDDNSEINLYNLENGERLFQWSSPAIETICFVNKESLLLGKASSPGNRGVMEILNPVTGEIAPLNDPYFYILDAYRSDKGIYTLGLKMDDNQVITELSFRELENIRESTSLFSIESEDYNSRIFIHKNELFVTLDGIGLLHYNGRRSNVIETPYDVKDMTFMDDKFVLLYKGNMLSFWDMNSLKADMDMNFFSDYSWLAVSAQQNAYYYTPEARDNFFVYRVIRR